MIHPVRAVGLASVGISDAWIRRICCGPACTARWMRIAVFGGGWRSFAEGLRGDCGLAGPGLSTATCDWLSQPLADQLTTPLMWGRRLQWQPCPVVPPFIDRVDHWWPSDEAFAIKPPCIAEDRPSPAPPQIVLWRDQGGLLDMWI